MRPSCEGFAQAPPADAPRGLVLLASVDWPCTYSPTKGLWKLPEDNPGDGETWLLGTLMGTYSAFYAG